MMQQIAPLQTDIAAKSKSDISSDMDKQWLGSGSQQEQRYGNGAEFSRALDQQKRENMKSTDSAQRDQSASSNSKQTKTADNQHDSTNASVKNDNQNTKSSEDSNLRASESDSAEEFKATPDKVKADKETKSEVTSNQSGIPVSTNESSDDKVEEPAINWVALVEEAQSLTASSDDSPISSVDPDSPISSVDPDMPIWDGEIDEMIAIDDTSLIVKKSAQGPIYKIELPPVQLDALTSGDAEKVAKAAESILAKLQSSDLVQEVDGNELKTIPNDLYIKPVADGEAELIAAEIAPSAELVTVIEKPINADIVVDAAQLPASDDDAPSLLRALMFDLVASANEQGAKNNSENEVQTQLNSPIETLTDSNSEVLATDTDQTLVNNLLQGGGTENSVKAPVIKLDASDSNALKALLKLDADQQKLVMNDIASRINALSTENVSSNQQQSFVAALQAGVEEFSKQLQQGREPGLSIKALIAEAMGSADIKADTVSAQQLSQMSAQLSQTLNLTDALRTTLNEAAVNTQQVARAELGSMDVASQTETNKQAQLSQMLDKPANITKPEGQNQFAEKIRWIVNARNSFAEIRLDPPDLGSVQVKVSTSGEAATVNFVVQTQQARDALEQAAPRLRDMLAQQGIELGQSSVQQESPQQQEQQQDGQFAQHKGEDGMEEVASDVIEQRATGGVAGGIDFYA